MHVVFNYWLPKIHLKLDLSISNMLLVEKKTHITQCQIAQQLYIKIHISFGENNIIIKISWSWDTHFISRNVVTLIHS
jgi:hypothetical protein